MVLKLEKLIVGTLLVAQLVTVNSSPVNQGFDDNPTATRYERQRSNTLLRKRKNIIHDRKEEDEIMFVLDEEVSRILQYIDLSMGFPSATPSLVSKARQTYLDFCID